MIKSLRTFTKLKSAAFNKEISAVYDECKPAFLNLFVGKYSPSLTSLDIEEVYNDAILALYDNIKSGKLTELSCSLQTYINRIGENKLIDLLRKRQIDTIPMSELEAAGFCERADEYWNTEMDKMEEERKSTIYHVVEKLIEPCKKILFSFYYDHFTMEMIAETMGFASPDVAKTQKSRCMSKAKRVAEIEFQNKGLV